MGGWWRDLRTAVRGARRRPRAAATIVGVLGLGIGATTAVFSVVDGVMLRALPFPEAHRLVAVGVTFPDREWRTDVDGLQHLAGVSYPNFVDVRTRARSLDRLVGTHRLGALVPDGPAGPELVAMTAVTERFFEVLGARPHLGRLFGPDDYAGRNGPVTLLSHGSWLRRFGGDPRVIGRPMGNEGASRVVVGVLPPGFRPPEAVTATDTEFWVPLERDHGRYENRGTRSLTLFGRLAPGASLEGARAELATLAVELARSWPDGNVYPDGSRLGWGANPLRAETVGASGRTLLVFLGAAGVLLAIASLNATHLLLVRSLQGASELGVRAALGASRGSLVRQRLVESLLLALLGGAVGAGLAAGAVAGVRRLAPDLVPRMAEVAVDVRVLTVVLTVSTIVGVIAGSIPALRVGGHPLVGRAGRPTGTVAGYRRRGMDALVALQVALALVLVVGGTLLTRSLVERTAVDPGFQAHGVTTFTMGTKRGPELDAGAPAWDALLEEVRTVPGVDAVAAASNLPFESPNWAPALRRPDAPPDRIMTGHAGYLVTPGYFEALGIPVVHGRSFTEADGPDDPAVLVVNEAFVAAHFEGEDPVGSTLRLGPPDDDGPARIVGVVGDVVQGRVEEGMRPAVYVPHRQGPAWPWVRVLVRSTRDLESLVPELRAAGARYAAHLPVERLAPLGDRIADTRAEPRTHTLLLVGFAAVALLLAAAGVHATLAHSVATRRREMGIRMAIGADPRDIVGLVVRRNAAIAAAGLLVGLAAAALGTGVLGRYLFQVPPRDPVSLAMSAAILATAVVAAGIGPALRATRVDPVDSLQSR